MAQPACECRALPCCFDTETDEHRRAARGVAERLTPQTRPVGAEVSVVRKQGAPACGGVIAVSSMVMVEPEGGVGPWATSSTYVVTGA